MASEPPDPFHLVITPQRRAPLPVPFGLSHRARMTRQRRAGAGNVSPSNTDGGRRRRNHSNRPRPTTKPQAQNPTQRLSEPRTGRSGTTTHPHTPFHRASHRTRGPGRPCHGPCRRERPGTVPGPHRLANHHLRPQHNASSFDGAGCPPALCRGKNVNPYPLQT